MQGDPIDLRILSAGRNWMNIGSLLAIELNGYYSPLPKGSTVSITTGDPGTMCMEAPRYVARGDYHLGITTPAWYLGMARAGLGPFREPLPLELIAIFPHDDMLGLAVRRETGITDLRQIAERQLPLKISMPTREMRHPGGWVVEEVLALHGVTQEALESWGGEVLSDRPRAQNAPDVVPVDPSFDAIFDEAIMTMRWRKVTEMYDLRFLPLSDEALASCAEMGMKPGVLRKGRLPGVEEDTPTIDFTGWALFCSEGLSDELGYLVAAAVEAQREAISARFTGPTAAMTSAIDMRHIADDAPVPLNAGAKAFYSERGYL